MHLQQLLLLVQELNFKQKKEIMKNLFKQTLAIAVIALSFSCSEEFLDNTGVAGESQPTASFTSADAEQAAQTNTNRL